ncbi:U8 snoRNA-decapping enzyme-like [Haemaphysalis longicornis]
MSMGSRNVEKPAVGTAEPYKHPLDLNIVQKLKLNQHGYEACSVAHALATGYRNVAHVMIWAPTDTMIMRRYKQKAVIMAVLRYDGYLGFPGGTLDPGETPAQAVNREMREEVNVDTSRFSVSEPDHLISFANAAKQFVCHFYSLRLTLDELLVIEKAAIGSLEHGHETLGILRVPLYTMAESSRGLPVFLAHKFAGTAREQLLYGAVRLGVLDADAVLDALKAAQHVGYT